MTTTDNSPSNQSKAVLHEPKIDWINILKQWKSSGVPQVSYCKANNINYNQFVYQKSKISLSTKIKSKLLPVKVTQLDPATPAQNNFILHYPNGFKLHIPINAHPEAIKLLLSCLEGRSC